MKPEGGMYSFYIKSGGIITATLPFPSCCTAIQSRGRIIIVAQIAVVVISETVSDWV